MPSKNPGLSLVLIVKNEFVNLAECLDSAKEIASEIVIVDAGSTDDTLKIARKYTDKIFIHPDWQGFGKQRQIAQSYASGNWILMLDADERLTPELVFEIKKSINQSDFVGFNIPRRNFFLGKELKFGGGTDKVLRLYKNKSGQCNDAEVHEKIIVTGKIGLLKNFLLHHSTTTLDFALFKMNQYSELGCQKLQCQQKSSSILVACFHGLWTFIRIYILQLGLLDGGPGFVLAILKAEGSYYKYLKLVFDQQNDNKFIP